jgi:seryl-tRNA synthetase
MDHLDARIKDLIAREFGAREFRYPTLIPTSVIRRCRYFQSFPHLMMFVSRLHADVDAYRSFLDDLDGGGDLADGLRAHASGFDYCLPPTMCFHTYHQFADRPLPEPTLAATARGKSFRFESHYRRSLERLWDFTIREIVFIGPQDHVLACRRRLMERTWELMDALELGGRCEVANDPFFVNVDTAERVWSQHLLELKYELRLPLEAERDVAVCSFNFHDRFFGESFGITTNDGVAYTACAGFGLERLAYAFLCRHGVNPQGWPRSIREAVTP